MARRRCLLLAAAICMAGLVAFLFIHLRAARRPDVDAFIALNHMARELETIRGELVSQDPVTTQALAPEVRKLANEVRALEVPAEYAPVSAYLATAATALGNALAQPPGHPDTAVDMGSYGTNQALFVVHITAIAPRARKPERPPAVGRKLSAGERELGEALTKHVDGNHLAAARQLLSLASKTRGKPLGAEASLCLGRMLSQFKVRESVGTQLGKPPIDLAIEELDRILTAGVYSPALFDAFLRWRSLQQIYRFGVLPQSPIPNRQYNKVRNDAIGYIRLYIRRHPADAHAWSQLRGLALCPNIVHTSLGNSATEEDRMLNPPIAKAQSPARIAAPLGVEEPASHTQR